MSLKENKINYYMYTHNTGIVEQFKEEEKRLLYIDKIKKFEQVQTLGEAKKLAKKLFQIQNEINYIRVGDAYCVIINRKNLFRIVIKSPKEVICYNFATKEEI